MLLNLPVVTVLPEGKSHVEECSSNPNGHDLVILKIDVRQVRCAEQPLPQLQIAFPRKMSRREDG